ncbi:MAG: Rpn family recombination-promoting nuclease/putative transposase [Lachnospiraceae bacterium]|nr:Rpn family recombination-promoting nuclease/putative transposase [Lachnospiraceae bacterium]
MAAKKYEELTFVDDFMFCKILQNNVSLCKELIELILEKKISRISFPERQKTIEITSDGKGIRLDVYVEGSTEVYDVEMQAVNKKNLPKRSRYYQGMIDLNLIERGADYEELKKSYIIFICTFDYFEQGLHRYCFENRCVEIPSLSLFDETMKIFLCTGGNETDISAELKEFLDFLNGNKAGDVFTQKLEDEVKKAREHEEWRQEYMTLLMRDRENQRIGREEGLEEGKCRTLVSLICKKIKKKYSITQIAEALEEEESTIREIYNIAVKYAPEYDEEKIFTAWKEIHND